MKRYLATVFLLALVSLATNAKARSMIQTGYILPKKGTISDTQLFVFAIESSMLPNEKNIVLASKIADGDLFLEEVAGAQTGQRVPLNIVHKYLSPRFVALELRPNRRLTLNKEYTLGSKDDSAAAKINELQRLMNGLKWRVEPKGKTIPKWGNSGLSNPDDIYTSIRILILTTVRIRATMELRGNGGAILLGRDRHGNIISGGYHHSHPSGTGLQIGEFLVHRPAECLLRSSGGSELRSIEAIPYGFQGEKGRSRVIKARVNPVVLSMLGSFARLDSRHSCFRFGNRQ